MINPLKPLLMRPLLSTLVALALAGLLACECEEIGLVGTETALDSDGFFVFQVADIGLFDQNDIDTDFDEIRIRFNRAVDIKSLEVELTLLINGENLLFDNVEVYEIRPDLVALPLCQRIICTELPCTIRLELREAGNRAVRSVDQLLLDGDYDGDPGGRYRAELLMTEDGC